MIKAAITSELMNLFTESPETLIFRGYCKYSDGTEIFTDSNNNFALSTRVLSNTKCCMYSRNLRFITDFVETLNGKVEFCGVNPFITEILRSKYTFLWETNCDLYCWNGKAFNGTASLTTRPMTSEFAQIISDGTPYHASCEEIIQCLHMHPSVAVFDAGRPVCWCIEHIEGSLGMLYTVPQYRHKGFAMQVMWQLCKQIVEDGDIPYAYIRSDNVASKNLAVKYNMKYVCRSDYFLIDFGYQSESRLV